MNTQAYLLCIKAPDSSVGWKSPKGGKNVLSWGSFTKKLGSIIASGDFILGDSLDNPFIKFIRVQSVSHEIAFGSKQWAYDPEKEVKSPLVGPLPEGAERPEVVTGKGDWVSRGKGPTDYDVLGARNDLYQKYLNRVESVTGVTDIAAGLGTRFASLFTRRNEFADVVKPDQKAFVFSKFIDNATPQFAYAASAQEPLWLCVFFFRRRIGTDITGTGVRLPFLMIGLWKSQITGWSISNMMETVKLKYKGIAWAHIPPAADTNAPGWVPAMRWWNVDDPGGGGLGSWAVLMTGLTTVLTTICAGFTAIAQVRSEDGAAL
jgi:type VI protein secretion system component Hcp